MMGDIQKKITIVLGTYNRLRFLKLTIESIRQELVLCSFSNEIIVVDGGSTDGTLKWLMRQKDIITIVQHNRGEWRGGAVKQRSWGYFMNLGFKCAQGKYVCMLSDDCLVVPGAIRNGVELFDKKLSTGEKIGAVAFYWRNWPDQEKYWVGLTYGNKIFVNHGLYLNDALKCVGYIDEDNYFFYHADGDLCLKIWQQGYECIESPESYIEHYAHANVKVRSSNQATERADWTTSNIKWEPLYGSADKDWIEKSYVDKKYTANIFKRWWLKL